MANLVDSCIVLGRRVVVGGVAIVEWLSSKHNATSETVRGCADRGACQRGVEGQGDNSGESAMHLLGCLLVWFFKNFGLFVWKVWYDKRALQVCVEKYAVT
jgi:hypothetical protein